MNIPVVLVIHRRPDLVTKTINQLRSIKPRIVYVIADGPKNSKEVRSCNEARYAIESIDWKCKVIRKYSNYNMGLRRRVVSGLNFVFKNENMAIILEEDLVIDPTFFKFCELNLRKYARNKKIISIAGNNFQFGKNSIKESYYFSRYVHSWGWATWRRAWQLYDDNMSKWDQLRSNNWLKSIFHNYPLELYWKLIFDMVLEKKVDSWAYRWTYTSFRHNALTIIPNKNLVSNIGYGKSATHTKHKTKSMDMKVESMTYPLVHPKKIIRNDKADATTEWTIYINPIIATSLLVRSIIRYIKK